MDNKPLHLSGSSIIQVLDSDGKNLGQMQYIQAQNLAKARDLDLVLINKTGSASVFKIMDHGKWKYMNKKSQKNQQCSIKQKEVRFSVGIDDHDLETKVSHIKRMINHGDEVKISVRMHGRQKANTQLAKEKIESILSNFVQIIKIQDVKFTPNSIYCIIKSGSIVRKNHGQESTTDSPNGRDCDFDKRDVERGNCSVNRK